MTTKFSQEELLNEQIAGLSPAKRALLELTLKKHAAKSAGNGFIPQRSHHSPAPLSFAQQRLWFLSELEPDSPAYNIPVARRLSGLLNVKALEQALGEIVRRHESLRTRFEDVGGVPQQVIDEPLEWKLKLVDLSNKDENERTAAAQRIASEEAQRPFALACEWGLRAQLLRLTEREHILLMTMHHIVSDGWSLGVLFGELKRLYEAYSRSEHYPALPELALQYADFAVWQREWLGAAELQKQLSYWKEQLAGVTPLELPLDKPRLVSPSYRGETQSLQLSKELSEQLQALARDEEATLFMVLLAAFQVLLSRYSGQTDISVGTPIANRTRAQLEELIGFFANTLVLRTDLSGDPSFVELLARVREVALAAYAHQDLPFEKLVEELQPERSLSRNPLFDVLFVVQNAPRSPGLLGEMRLEPWGESSKTTRVDLEVHVVEGAQGLACNFVYATDLFAAETIERLMGHYEQLLEAVVADPGRRLSELPLLTSAEWEQLRQWNETSSAYPEQCIPQLFEAQAQQQGGALAVRCGAEELSYAELNERANQLAHYLQRQGVGAETRVGLCVERSLELVVGLLGILKAGGAYVPLDPVYPRARLEYMVGDAGVRLLLTQSSLVKHWQGSGLQIVELDRGWEEIAGEERSNPSRITEPDNLAYVIYTSGSTGKPKGVAMPHRALVSLITWQNNNFPVTLHSRTLQYAPVSFDVSFQEMFTTWCSGATLVMVTEEVRRDPLALCKFLLAENVERLFVPFVALQQLAEAVEKGAPVPTTLRDIIAAGEQLQITPQIAALFRELHDCGLHNHYGPTEAHVVTAHTLSGDVTDWPPIVPVGRPIANTQIYVLDSHLSPVPSGVAGEIYIGGDALARGYLNRPDLTAERFIPNPFKQSGRLYKTGDRGLLANGNLQFLGRLDDQLKIRGHRVESAEVEVALAEDPLVSECVVVIRDFQSKDKRLVAYLVANDQHDIDIQKLRARIKQKLPDYMLPSVYIVLSKMPLTPSGKIDRAALPEPDQSRPELHETLVKPRTPTEATLSRIWAEILKLDKVGVEDNFFDLGGHSLLATQLISRVDDVLGLKLPLRTLFEAPTVREMAEVITSDESYVWPTVMKIQPVGTRRPIFFVAAPDVNALGYMALANHLGNDQPLYGLQSQKYVKTKTDEYGRPLLEFSQAVVEELASEYVKAMREVQPHGPYMLGGMCRGAHIAFEMALQLKAQGETVSLLAILDTWVMENSYSYWFYVDHYIQRVRWFSKVDTREKVRFAKQKIGGLLHKIAVLLKLRTDQAAHLPPWNAVYWPGPSFVPKIYDGPITVFRVPKQSAIFIRNDALAWDTRSTRDVQVEIVPGKHETILREPSVNILASRLAEIMAATEATLSKQPSELIQKRP